MRTFNFTSENVLNTLTSLSENIFHLGLYLDNAKRLEELKVSQIEFLESPFSYDEYNCGIYRNSKGEIVCINKYYTDGQIESVGQEHKVDKSFNYSKISFSVDNQNQTESFVFIADNDEHGYQCRQIQITDFGFDGSKLPTEEEIQSYEIPKYLIKK